MRILLAEDERDLNRVIVKKMKAEGYYIDSCYDGKEALDYFKLSNYDVAIVDVMMPHMDGFQLVSTIRDMNIHTPVIFLTARDTVEDKVKGLDLGANDYVVKPFSFKELMARIRVLSRKPTSEGSGNSNIYKAGDLTLDMSSHRVTRNGDEIYLTVKEYALLEFLIRNKGQVLSREQIEDNLWNVESGSGSNAVDVYIRYLRKKVDDPYEVKLIRTVRGVGYVLNDESKEK